MKKLKSIFASKTASAATATMAVGGHEQLLRAPAGSLQSNAHPQIQSPLFALPAEIRSLIFTYALTDYEDTTLNSYDTNTYWYRPGYAARRRTATELLRVCKRVFQETWFLPFALAEHSFYLTLPHRAPATHITVDRMRGYLETLRDFALSQDGMEMPQILHVRVFAQLWALEDPARLQELLSLAGFEPRVVTITLRYTDFWYWEEEIPLHIDARWVNTVKFPRSVAAIKMDFEMIDRRKTEIDFITDVAVQKWTFRREDGVVFVASPQDVMTSRWTGSSTWGNRRWIRDESRPNEIDYYVKTVTWKPAPELGTSAQLLESPNLDVPNTIVREPAPNVGIFSSVSPEDVAAANLPRDASPEQIAYAILPASLYAMSGYVGNLSADKEKKLKELWILLFTPILSFLATTYGIELPSDKTSATAIFKILNEVKEPTAEAVIAAFKKAAAGDQSTATNGTAEREQAASTEATTNGAVDNSSEDPKTPATNGETVSSDQKLGDISNKKVPKEKLSGLMAQLRETDLKEAQLTSIEKILSSMTPKEMGWTLLNMIKQDNPDAVLLRFLRARKWDVGKAFSMMISNYIWRVESQVDEEILPGGELKSLKQTQDSSDKTEEKKGTDFLAQLRMGKAYLHGVDRDGRPVIRVNVRIHKPGAQTEEALERYILHVIEMTRLMLKHPVETGTILFDMTGFGLSNMEFPPVKFIIQCFESNYPECLGRLLIHNAPWVFSGVWKLIRPLMDPVVASKVQFTKSIDDLSQFIAPENILKDLGGTDDWTYKYIEPDPKENDLHNDTDTKNAIMAERMSTALDFILQTSAWIGDTNVTTEPADEATIREIKDRRSDSIARLRKCYWKIDPYIRARCQMDREGAIFPEAD
ncbi:CRAL-TRIO domain-containing protein C3H8,02 [Talaromyces islandicus]|uniref:CRAL-TRIO domain-containing protein C3H8,02 n=1 Tax=Talaromyces islandicus TaxID=28573 RepID=A0A0U1LMU5_TALIS|nr:CRAL-TRIO domain-containing protein C3H8,02 [Talaromyces islandicus]